MPVIQVAKYLYKSHSGGEYSDEAYKRDEDDLFCRGCGAYDIYLGTFKTDNERTSLIIEFEEGERR